MIENESIQDLLKHIKPLEQQSKCYYKFNVTHKTGTDMLYYINISQPFIKYGKLFIPMIEFLDKACREK